METPDPAQFAGSIGLKYVHDDAPAFRRKRWGRGFTYLDPQARHVKDQAVRERFEKLAIPPAWTDVWICANVKGHIQVTGRDEQGRKQYIYHPKWEQRRQAAKFDRLLPFGEALPNLRAHIEKDLAQKGHDRTAVTALAVAMLDRTLIRVGHAEYTKKNGSYGLTTLQTDHVSVRGGTVKLSFQGKGGKPRALSMNDPQLARLIRAYQELPGQHLFQYLDEDGACHPIDSTDVNDYLQAVTGEPCTAKDFRTWGGTVAAVECLRALDPGETVEEREAMVPRIIEYAAERLGNTPAVCRAYYVHPHILEAYLDGRFHEAARKTGKTRAAGNKAKQNGTARLENEAIVRDILRRAQAGS